MRVVKYLTSNTNDFQYITDFRQGWFSLTNTSKKEGFGMAFSTDVFRSLYMMFFYQGYRSLYFSVVERWTGCSPSLFEAEENGVYTELESKESLESVALMLVHLDFQGLREAASGEVEAES